MKKKRVSEILNNKIENRKKVSMLLCFSCVLIFLGTVFLLSFINMNKTYYVGYEENSDLDYKVYLKENDFFKDKYIGKDNEYISTLIDYIDANFYYDLEMDNNVSRYDYSYSVKAEVTVKKKNSDNLIYKSEDVLVPNKLFTSNSNEKLIIKENVLLNYDEYNDLISKFVKVYNLEDVVSTLSVSLYVNVNGNCSDNSDAGNSKSVIKLDIPLTTNTLSIDMNYDLIDNAQGVMACRDDNKYIVFLLIFSILCYGFSVSLIVLMFRFVYATRTAESIYSKELKKILTHYGSYIQKINNNFDMKGYQMLKVDTFTDMLEIRDTIQEPILMVENKEENCTYFLIPGKTKILYSYRLKVEDIQDKIDGNNLSV